MRSQQGPTTLTERHFLGDNRAVTVLWMISAALGLVLAIWASGHALDAAVKLGTHLGLSAFVIGVTIVAVGTGLPEVANSIIASARDHGDLNVGNSTGSVVTQLTVVLGLLCFVGGLESTRRFIATTLSPGIGPLLFPAVLSDGIGKGSMVAASVVAASTVLLIRSPRPTRWTGLALIGLYLAMYPLLLA